MRSRDAVCAIDQYGYQYFAVALYTAAVSALGVELSDLVFREDVAFSNSESMFLLDVMRCEEFPTPLLAARARRVYMLCLARSF